MPSGYRLAALTSVAGATALLTACGPIIPPGRTLPQHRRPPAHRPAPAPAPRPASPTSPTTIAPVAGNAVSAGVVRGPAVGSLALGGSDAARALSSFRESCPKLLARIDASGLTVTADWQSACAASTQWPASDAVRFFVTYFETARVGAGATFDTGYYEPEIAGVRTHQPGFDVPVYALPSDLVRARAGDAAPLANGRMPLGRYDADGRFISYWDRAAIEDGALAGKGLEIAWVADPVEFFFLQVQGSGRLRAPDGSVMRLAYAGQNGFSYGNIGAIMRQQGLIGDGAGQYPGSMQGVMRYLRDNPADGRALMRRNQSWIFFRELIGDGPLGALGVPVRRHASVAADPQFVPLGAPVWLDTDRADVNGVWIAQDTGGAIKGPNRFDTFWGAGSDARLVAGGMSAHGKALILLPKGTLARLGKP